MAWLNTTLEGLTTTWKFVAGHHPITDENVRLMAPSLRAHGVQAYLAGHVHNLQYALGKDGVNYFISGAGAFSSAVAGVDGVVFGKSHLPRTVVPPGGAVAGFEADGPGFLSFVVDNAANPPTVAAAFYRAGNATPIFETNFTAA